MPKESALAEIQKRSCFQKKLEPSERDCVTPGSLPAMPQASIAANLNYVLRLHPTAAGPQAHIRTSYRVSSSGGGASRKLIEPRTFSSRAGGVSAFSGWSRNSELT